MFAATLMPGMMMAFPDVCITPIPAVPAPIPTPIPYPNMGETTLSVTPTAAMNVLNDMMPTVNLATVGTVTEGDEAGVMLGVASGLMMGPAVQILGSETVLADGPPMQRLTGMTTQNLTNAPGFHTTPSQPTVLVLG